MRLKRVCLLYQSLSCTIKVKKSHWLAYLWPAASEVSLPCWIKCKWQQRFCITELSVHGSSAFVSNYGHIFSFWISLPQFQALKMMGSLAFKFSYPTKIAQPFFTLWSLQNVLWSIVKRHDKVDPNFVILPHSSPTFHF